MTTVTLPLYSAATRPVQNTSLVSPLSDDASKANYILPQRSSLLEAPAKAIVTKQAQPQPTQKDNTTTAATQAQVTPPEAPAPQAVVTPAQNFTAASTPSLSAVSTTAPAELQASTPTSTAQPSNDSATSAADQTPVVPQTPTISSNNSAQNAEAVSQAPAQGNLVQATAYSSVASATASTIRGVGVNIIS